MTVRPEPSRNCDVEDEDEIVELMTRFYSKVAQDEIIGPMYNDVAHVNWAEHVDKTARFWNSTLFGADGYNGNPREAHKHVNEKRHFTHEMFYRWHELFTETVDNGWAGPNAEIIKRKATKSVLAYSQMLTGTPVDIDIDTTIVN